MLCDFLKPRDILLNFLSSWALRKLVKFENCIFCGRFSDNFLDIKLRLELYSVFNKMLGFESKVDVV